MSASGEALSGRLSAALEAAGDAAYAWELDGDRLEWSGQLSVAAGGPVPSEVATGRLFAARVHPDDLVHRQLALAAHLDNGAAFDCEYRLRDNDGNFIWVHERG